MSNKVVGYMRTATKKQINNEGCNVQNDRIINFCKEKNYEIVQLFSDEGVSGVGDITERFSLMEMINFCKEQDVQYVLVDKIYRLSRELYQQLFIEKELLKSGVKVLSVSENNLTDDPIKEIMNNVLEAFANLERKVSCKIDSNHEKLEYGIVKEFNDSDLWYEPITDVTDGFVLRDKNSYIRTVYPKRKDEMG